MMSTRCCDLGDAPEDAGEAEGELPAAAGLGVGEVADVEVGALGVDGVEAQEGLEGPGAVAVAPLVVELGVEDEAAARGVVLLGEGWISEERAGF